MTQTDTKKPNGANGTSETAVTTQPPSHSERFTNAVMREFSANNGGQLNLTSFQKKLCQNYFIKIDMMLKDSEIKRLQKKSNQDPTPLTWENVNLQKLANDVIIYSSVGLDPTQPNQLNPIPYKNKHTGKYDITFIPGYRGIELKAKKYGLDMPDEVVVELVYEKDKFVQIKKDSNHKVESYVFEVTENFDRGEIVGGFYYHSYFDKPEKNKLRVFTKKDIDKRKPEYASVEFWGGEKDKWQYNQETQRNEKVGKEQVEGWYDEMAYKTIYRAAYNAITIDSEKIDSNYLALVMKESEYRDNLVQKEITDNANKKTMEFEDAQVVTDAASPAEIPENVDKQTGEVKEPEKKTAPF